MAKTIATVRLLVNKMNPEVIGNTSNGADSTGASATDAGAGKRTYESLRVFARAIEQSPVMILITDPEGNIQYVNPQFEQSTGYSSVEVIGQNPRILSSGENLPEAYRELWTTIASGKAWRGEFYNRRKDGTLFLEQALISPILDEQGNLTNILAVKEDITERKKMVAMLSDSQVFLQGILDSLSSQIAVIDSAGEIVAINDSWRRFSIENNTKPGEMAPNTDIGANYLSVCGANDACVSSEILNVRLGIQAVLDERLPTFCFEYPCHSPQKQRWFLMTVTPLGSDRRRAVVNHSDVTARKLAEEEIRNLAYYDSLTHLPNRRMLNDRLALTLAGNKRTGLFGAVMMIDLDNFKPLNDEHGHAVGDLLLIEVARRVSGCVREVDTVARLGGDEFVVALCGLSSDGALSREQAAIIAEKIQAALRHPYLLTLHREVQDDSTIEHQCSASIGVALFAGETNQDGILKRADSAMYRAKKAGRNSIRFCDEITSFFSLTHDKTPDEGVQNFV